MALKNSITANEGAQKVPFSLQIQSKGCLLYTSDAADD